MELFWLLIAVGFYALGFWHGKDIGKLDAMIEANEIQIVKLEAS